MTVYEPNIKRDRCAVTALRLALKHLGPSAIATVIENGTLRFTQRGRDISYICETLELYDGVTDEHGEIMYRKDT